MVIEITDIASEEAALYSRLTEAQLRNRLEPEKGVFIAESPKVIRVALDRGCTPVSMLMEARHIEGQAKELIARCGDIPVYTGSRETLSQITGYALTRGVLCAMRRPKALTLEDVCRDSRRIAVIDGVVNAENIGAIFRAAASLGMGGVALTRSCCDPLNRRSVRVSMGTVFQIPWCYIGERAADWPDRGLEQLHALGYATAAMALSDNSISIGDDRLKKEERLAIILGTEGDGLSPEVLERCSHVVKIPMMNGVDSLNVAAAAAVAFWEICKADADSKPSL